MRQSIVLTGMVLSSMPVGEYDRRITLLTRERGKVTAFVRGARRPKSSMIAATNPFCFGRFEAYEGKSAYTVVKASIDNYFMEIGMDLEKTCYGCYFLEVADYFSYENADCENQLKLLYQTLRAMSVPSLSLPLIRSIYELKSLVFQGIYPNVFSCMQCQTKEHLIYFHTQSRGVLCKDCGHPASSIYLDDASRYALQFIVASKIEKLYTFTVKESVLHTIQLVVSEYMKKVVDKKFKSLDFLQDIPFLPE